MIGGPGVRSRLMNRNLEGVNLIEGAGRRDNGFLGESSQWKGLPCRSCTAGCSHSHSTDPAVHTVS